MSQGGSPDGDTINRGMETGAAAEPPVGKVTLQVLSSWGGMHSQLQQMETVHGETKTGLPTLPPRQPHNSGTVTLRGPYMSKRPCPGSFRRVAIRSLKSPDFKKS